MFVHIIKLDGVGPIDKRPYLHIFRFISSFFEHWDHFFKLCWESKTIVPIHKIHFFINVFALSEFKFFHDLYGFKTL